MVEADLAKEGLSLEEGRARAAGGEVRAPI
jgi:hypothetical protein